MVTKCRVTNPQLSPDPIRMYIYVCVWKLCSFLSTIRMGSWLKTFMVERFDCVRRGISPNSKQKRFFGISRTFPSKRVFSCKHERIFVSIPPIDLHVCLFFVDSLCVLNFFFTIFLDENRGHPCLFSQTGR